MRLALCVAHAGWYPHRSGYEYSNPRWVPDEYGFSRQVARLAEVRLDDAGHTVRVWRKDPATGNCHGECAPNTRRCAKYAAAMFNLYHDVRRWQPDLAIEVHINAGPPRASGATVLSSCQYQAREWGEAWLDSYTSSQCVVSRRGRGLWWMGATSKIDSPIWHPGAKPLFGYKRFLNCGYPAVICEAGFASSATDSAYLVTALAVEAAAAAIVEATAEVAKV